LMLKDLARELNRTRVITIKVDHQDIALTAKDVFALNKFAGDADYSRFITRTVFQMVQQSVSTSYFAPEARIIFINLRNYKGVGLSPQGQMKLAKLNFLSVAEETAHTLQDAMVGIANENGIKSKYGAFALSSYMRGAAPSLGDDM